jgi:hypothetical protein
VRITNLIQEIQLLKKDTGRPTKDNVPLFDLGYNKALEDVIPLVEKFIEEINIYGIFRMEK